MLLVVHGLRYETMCSVSCAVHLVSASSPCLRITVYPVALHYEQTEVDISGYIIRMQFIGFD